MPPGITPVPTAARTVQLPVGEAEDLLAAREFAPGLMEPKIASAAGFTHATGRPALITTIGQMQAALGGEAGTQVVPD